MIPPVSSVVPTPRRSRYSDPTEAPRSLSSLRLLLLFGFVIQRAPAVALPYWCDTARVSLPIFTGIPAALARFFFATTMPYFATAAAAAAVCVAATYPPKTKILQNGSQCVRILSAVVPGGLSFELNQCLREGVLSLQRGRALACTEPFRIPLAGKVIKNMRQPVFDEGPRRWKLGHGEGGGGIVRAVRCLRCLVVLLMLSGALGGF